MMKKNTHTLLVVDDEYFEQELLKMLLKGEKYEVIVASNGEQALQIVTQNKPDLILLDLVMPGLDGFQTAKLLKENPETRKIPVVVVTGMEDRNKRIEALEIGVDDFLNKPVDKIELLVRVKNLLQSRTYFKQLQDRQAHLFQLESLASLGTLINSVTNEISKPLLGLQEVIALAQAQCVDDSQLPDLLAQATQYAKRIDLVVHNMGLYIKSISGQPMTESCDITRVLEQVLELLTNKMEEANIRIQTDIAPDLPLVQCSAEGLMHVLVHVLLNAYDGSQDCPEPIINICIKAIADKHLELSVFDNNIDVAENMSMLATDPLFSTRLPGVCESLGLALACHFIEKSGGSISIDSVVGRGSCINVMLKTV